MRVAFIGLGHMGHPMARILARAGHAVSGVDIVPALLARAAAHGIAPAPSIAACVSQAEWVVTMLPSSPHVRSAYGGGDGIVAHAASGARLIDSSTIDPMAAREVASLADARGLAMIDAPVSGGTAGAEAGSLTFTEWMDEESLVSLQTTTWERHRLLTEAKGLRKTKQYQDSFELWLKILDDTLPKLNNQPQHASH